MNLTSSTFSSSGLAWARRFLKRKQLDSRLVGMLSRVHVYAKFLGDRGEFRQRGQASRLLQDLNRLLPTWLTKPQP